MRSTVRIPPKSSVCAARFLPHSVRRSSRRHRRHLLRSVVALALAGLSWNAAVGSTAATGQASGIVQPYDAQAIPSNSFVDADRGAWPAWRRGLARGQWVRLPGSDLENAVPEPRVQGSLKARIDAWNGLAADRGRNRLYSAANGGHADYAGNEVYELDLSKDRPRWTMLRGPTPRDAILASNYNRKEYNDYYRDGRPASTHTYYALQFVASRNAVFKFGAGSLWGTGNEANWKTDAFSLENDDWQPAGTWPDVAEGPRKLALAASVCIDPSNEHVYVAAPGRLHRFDPASGSYESLAKWPQNSTAVRARACAVDPVRRRVIFFGNAYRNPDGGLVYDIESRSLREIRFHGAGVADVTQKKYNYAWYEPAGDAFLVKTSQGSTIYVVDAEDFTIRSLETTGGESIPNAANGVQSRWQRLPALGGYAYYPRAGSGVWFLAIE